MRLTPPIKFWLATASALTAVAGMVGAGAFGVQYVRTNWQIVAEARATLGRLEQNRGKVIAAGRTLDRLEAEQKLIARSFVDPASPLAFIEAVEDLGRRSGVRAELALGSAGVPGEAYALSAEGPFRAVMTFLERMESMPFMVELGDIELTRSGAAAAAREGQAREAHLRLRLSVRAVQPGP